MTSNGGGDAEETGESDAAVKPTESANQITEQNPTSVAPNPPQDTTAKNDDDATTQAKPSQFRVIRVDGKLRPVDLEGNLIQDPEFEKKRLAAMEELTQRSSMMSATQENSESAYEQFDIQKRIVAETGEDSEDEERPISYATAQDSLLRQHASTRTDSTTHTYGEDDTGHVNFDFIPNLQNEEIDEHVSQEASSAAPRIEPESYQLSYDPQTPAPPINPFSQKGSVLKGFEMFGATQPSSIARHVASPTSSRPSPDVYNDFTSPPQKRMFSSPLVRRIDGDESSPLQSSVRDLLRPTVTESPLPATTPRMSGVKSFDSRSRREQTSSIREPRSYVSMKASQERRRKGTSSVSPNSDGESSDSDMDESRRKRQRKIEREQNIQKELAAIELHKRPIPSKPEVASSGPVEVPSTGRRRSLPDDYIAQSTGQDARDTQQDEMVADSQNPLDENELREPNGPEDNSKGRASSEENLSQIDGPNQTAPSPKLSGRAISLARGELEVERDQGSIDKTADNVQSSDGDLNQPNLPLQEVSSNRNDLRTPVASKTQVFSDGADTMVPETSPPDTRLLPMTEIATISFGAETEDDMHNLPGFTQDVEFERAIRIPSSPEPLRPQLHGERDANTDTPTVAAEPVEEPKLPIEATQNYQPENSDQDPGTAAIGPKKATDAGDDHDSEEHAANEAKKNPAPLMKTPEPSVGAPRDLRSQSQLKGPSALLRRSVSTNTPKTATALRSSSRVSKPTSTANSGGATSSTRLSTMPNTAAGPRSTSQRSMATPAKSSSATRPSTRESARKVIPENKSTSVPTTVDQTSNTDNSVARPSKKSSAEKQSTGKDQTPVLEPVPHSSVTRSSQRLSASRAVADKEQTPVPTSGKLTSKRKSGPVLVDDGEVTARVRSSKRKSGGHNRSDSSEDPLALPADPTNTVSGHKKQRETLFRDMAFAVSYGQQLEKDSVLNLIMEHGGKILDDGFDGLFDTGTPSKSRKLGDEATELTVSPTATSIGFTALIADEHSRKPKYMQALALGLPCISGRWISACVAKDCLVNWTPFLLCAGQSSFLGNAIRSRMLQPYRAADAKFSETFSGRDKLLDGKSILLVSGKGKAEEKRKPYVFLARAMGASRLGQVVDFAEAKKKLLASEAEEKDWDLLHVDGDEKAAEAAVFGHAAVTSSGGLKKRKRGPIAADENNEPVPKKIRIISDEVVIQSLILGQLLEE